MNCPKCKKEIDENCKFCSNCGAKIEDKSVSNIENLAKTCSKVWYILGYVRAKSTEKELKKFEESIRRCDEEMFNWYQEVIAHWKKWVKENNEKNKKENGSKRIRIPKAEGNKTQQK